MSLVSSSMVKPQPHVVLFLFPAQGHSPPFLSLATRLHHYWPGLTITLVSTSHHTSLIRSFLPLDSRLRLHSLPFYPADHGLPASAESLADLPVAQFITFFKATETLYPAFDDFISSLVSNASNHAPLCIVTDFFLGWTVDVARKYKVFHTTFLTMGAFGGAVFFSLWLNLPHTLTESDRFTLPEYPEVVMDRSQLSKYILEADGTDEWSQFFKRQIIFLHETDAIVVNTVEEFEPLGLGMLRKTLKFPIWPIGPPLAPAHQPSSSKSEDETAIMTFLDSQPPASVLYISFGSQNTIPHEQMMHLAQGLEGSGCSFIWVIRPPIGSDPRGGFRDDWLPHGFKDRIKQKHIGLLVHGWAPQLKILGHRSTGAFLSHCGWNSILESMSHGVPIIAWPVSADQSFNSMMLIELGLGVELVRGPMESSGPTKEKVEEVVDVMMEPNEKGMEIRRRAKEYRDVMNKAWDEEGGSSMESLQQFVQSINTAAGNQ
ncbi:UDP-glycosyltransferase 92A1-like protein [Carex littledalei]|uniref:Glycosyltransferase n=1 Tax=Carex littledalei TaxID=544730 RepID=A0A833VE84_9POAL|nr:UDP-glycosyltransferase 92A1-like protein [Carex littledalei]